MSIHYMPSGTLDGKWSRTNQRTEGAPGKYSKSTTGPFQQGYLENRRAYPYHDNERIPSAEVPAHRRFARDEPHTHPEESGTVVPDALRHAPDYRLGRIILVVDSDHRHRFFPLSRKYYRSPTDHLFVDDRGTKYFSVHHYIQMKMMQFYAGRVPESEPHFQSSVVLRAAAQENDVLYENARQAIQSVADLKRVMGSMKLREFNFDFWFQSQTILDAMVEANFLKFTQNQDLREMLLSECGNEHAIFMEVSGFDQCFYGSGYTMDFLQRTDHFYTDRPQLWRGWNNFGESLRLVRRLLSFSNTGTTAARNVGEKRGRFEELA